MNNINNLLLVGLLVLSIVSASAKTNLGIDQPEHIFKLKNAFHKRILRRFFDHDLRFVGTWTYVELKNSLTHLFGVVAVRVIFDGVKGHN